MEGNDVLVILPTGFGINILIYQLFPRLFHRLRYPHVAQPSSVILVVTALTAIIDDQVKYLSDGGFRAAAINSEADSKRNGNSLRKPRDLVVMLTKFTK